MASPPMLGLVEVPGSLEATLVSSPHTTPICGKGTISSKSGGYNMGNVLPFVPAMGPSLLEAPGTKKDSVHQGSGPLQAPDMKKGSGLDSLQVPDKKKDLIHHGPSPS
ncbi:hypothetical protein LWI28_023340 [Acer negundo]|uniref:Uncharacterized protein n=1 Tax=Acer negundo TaxID=4023 RepID=A0AAD5NSV6_ACENE|nr:hypothetical protein LWI28_023340 [Acer negundo]